MQMMTFGYDPSDIDDEGLVSDIPVSLLEKLIRSQFENPTEYRKKDYVQSFQTKYEINSNYCNDDDEQELVDEQRENFIAFMMQIMNEYLSVSFPRIDDMDQDDQDELIHLTYRYFMKNIKRNFVNVIINYIYEKQDEISAICERKKDVTSLNFKDEIDNEYDILVIANLSLIIEHILTQTEILAEDFLRLSRTDDCCLETDFVVDNFDNNNITGNFTQKYFALGYDFISSEGESKIRNKILKKYPNRKMIVDAIEETEDSDIE